MKMHVTFDDKVNCVVGRFEGDMTLDTAKKYLMEVTEVAKKHPCQRFLNDLREAKIDLSIFDLYELPGMIVTEGFDIRWRRAILLAPTADLDKMDFFDLVASNRGLIVRLFTDYDKAIEWLRTGYVSQP
jgi:hypothetical protein